MGIFARILKTVLENHQHDDLGGQGPKTDPIWYPLRRIGVLPATIERLQDSFESDDKHASLNPDEFDRLLKTLHLSEEEEKQLKAAMIAHGIEVLLYNRMKQISTADAIDIAEIVYEEIVIRFKEAYKKVRGNDGMGKTEAEQTIDAALALANNAYIFLDSFEEAVAAKNVTATRFWQQVTITAYREIGQLLQPIAPELAATFTAVVTRLTP